jgi:hypothetical protein
MLVGPQTHGSATQISGKAPSLAQSVSDAQGWTTVRQAPPQTEVPDAVQDAPELQSDCCQQAPLDVLWPASLRPPS